MKKLSLNLEALAVESFDTAENGEKKIGTVRAYVCSDMCSGSCQPTCGIVPVSYDSECDWGAIPVSGFNCTGDTVELSVCGPCCV
jgi:hypothetical protein